VRASEPEEAGAAQAMVQEIRHWLSLNVTELARVIGVERATIYGWIKGTAAMPRELAKRDRLRLVSHIAQQWRDVAGEPLGSWRQFPISNGRSLLDLLDASWEVSESELHLAVTDLVRESRHAGAARLAGIRQREDAPSRPAESADARLEANLKWLRTTGAG
jgi:predicted transcriptional regulator